MGRGWLLSCPPPLFSHHPSRSALTEAPIPTPGEGRGVKAQSTSQKSQAVKSGGVSKNCFPDKRPGKGGVREKQTFNTSPDLYCRRAV